MHFRPIVGCGFGYILIQMSVVSLSDFPFWKDPFRCAIQMTFISVTHAMPQGFGVCNLYEGWFWCQESHTLGDSWAWLVWKLLGISYLSESIAPRILSPCWLKELVHVGVTHCSTSIILPTHRSKTSYVWDAPMVHPFYIQFIHLHSLIRHIWCKNWLATYYNTLPKRILEQSLCESLLKPSWVVHWDNAFVDSTLVY